MKVERADLGATLRRLRLTRGLKLADMAYTVGMDPANLSRLERGKQGYSHALLETIAHVLGVRLSELFREAEREAGDHVREEGAGYAASLKRPAVQMARRYHAASPAARALMDTLLELAAQDKLPDALCRSLAQLLQPLKKTPARRLKRK
ncbi:MAG: XRE family transcriptional regulator [Gammaproteobacteria bacterium]|nr:MAG: XRE family transcriptional regulator [Gammaproteobacteria bacterium]